MQMKIFRLAILGAALCAQPALAQDADATEPAAEDTGVNPTLSLGTEVPQNGPGTAYVLSTHKDWEVRCIRANEGQIDPCQAYQLLTDQNGNPVAEFSMFLVGGQEGVVAGATIATPLETLLNQPLVLQIDGGQAKQYPYTFCNTSGCFARIGLTENDLAGFRKGNQAIVSIVPLAAPDQRIGLNTSLSGFTAAFNAMVEAQKPAE